MSYASSCFFRDSGVRHFVRVRVLTERSCIVDLAFSMAFSNLPPVPQGHMYRWL